MNVVAPLATDVPLSGIPLGQSPSYYYGLDGAGLSKRFNTSAVLNVADFPGVDRSGATDSYAGIQACFDLAFGPASNPHGNNANVNRPVYFPKGNYTILTPLKLTAVWGGKIFGDGIKQSNIGYAGPLTPVSAEGWIPTLWLNGCNFTEISHLFFSGPADNVNHKTVCLWWGPDGIVSSSAHGNLMVQIGTGGNASYGIIHGSAGSAANSENTYLGCTIFGFHDVGVLLSGANTLNFRWIGGGIDSCKTGIKTNNAATMPIIECPAFANNTLDIDLAASGRCVISGVRTESGQLLRANTAVTLLNCHGSLPGDRVTGSISGNTLTVTALGTKGAILFPGMIVFGPGIPNQYNSQEAGGLLGLTRIVQQLTGPQFGTGTYQLSRGGLSVPSQTLAIAGMLVELQGAAGATMIDCGSDNDQCIVGDNNSALHIHGNQWFSANDGSMAPHLTSAYSGQIFAYDISGWGGGQQTVGHLPTPHANMKGVRMFVTDSNVTTFGTTVAGGGTNAVPVWCDGTAWKVG